MSQLFRFPNAVRHDLEIDAWMQKHPGELGAIAQEWFEVMRACGADVRELLHDGHPTACVTDAAFGYVNAFKAHINVGFFRGAELPDPAGLLEGTGKFMRHVKLRPGHTLDALALKNIINTAYFDMQVRLKMEIESPAWHAEELAATAQRLAHGKEKVIIWADAKRALRKKAL